MLHWIAPSINYINDSTVLEKGNEDQKVWWQNFAEISLWLIQGWWYFKHENRIKHQLSKTSPIFFSLPLVDFFDTWSFVLFIFVLTPVFCFLNLNDPIVEIQVTNAIDETMINNLVRFVFEVFQAPLIGKEIMENWH